MVRALGTVGSTGVGTETSTTTKIFGLFPRACWEQLEMSFALVFGTNDV